MQPVGCIHGQYVECCFGLGGFVQLGHDQVQTISALHIAIPAFTALRAQGSLYICLDSLAPASPFLGRPRGRAGKTSFAFRTISAVVPRLVDLICEDSFRVTPNLPVALLHHRLEVASLVKIAPARLFQICKAVHDGQVKILPKFRGIRALSAVDCRFKVFSALIQQVDVCRILDV